MIENEKENQCQQLNLFVNNNEIQMKEQKQSKLQNAIMDIKTKYGKNAILKGMNFIEGGTTIERNRQIGGHSE